MQFTSLIVNAILATAATAAVVPTIPAVPAVPALPALPALPAPVKGVKGAPSIQVIDLEAELTRNGTHLAGRSITADRMNKGADVLGTLISTYKAVTKGIKADIEGRKLFTQRAVANVRAATGLNAVICNVGYDTTPDSIPGFSTVRYTFDSTVGADVTFDMLTFPNGMEFYRKGDGGYQNWAFLVDSRCKINGASVDCRI